MTRELCVTVDGLEFYGDSGPFGIEKEGFKGWSGSVAPRLGNIARTGADGTYSLPSYKESRVISLSGIAHARSSLELQYLNDRFSGVLANGQLGRIQVARPWGTTWAKCQIAGEPLFEERGGTGRATFQLQLNCPDPRKFGDLRTFDGSSTSPVTLFHRGNYGASSRVTINGSMPGGYHLVTSAGTVTVTAPLVTGQPHSLDFHTRRLRVNGTTTLGKITNNGFWKVQPGQSLPMSLVPVTSGSGNFTATLLDTYI